MGSDLFSIDGEKIIVSASGMDVGALNAELATKVVNGKMLHIRGENDGPQILEILAAGDGSVGVVHPEEPVAEPVSPVIKKKRSRPHPKLPQPEASPEPLGLIVG